MTMKTKKRTNVLRNINILVLSLALVVIFNLLIAIMNNSRENIEVIQVETKKYNNPMGREKNQTIHKTQISAEEFCKVLNEIEGKEMYYIDKNNKIALKECYEKILSAKESDSKERNCYKNYTSQDIELLANVMYIEVEEYINDENAEFIFKLVGSVVLNRVSSEDYEDTLEGVIWEENQYAKTTLDKLYTKQIPEKVYKWAEELLKEGALGPETLIYQSENKQGSDVFYKYGNQYFCLK